MKKTALTLYLFLSWMGSLQPIKQGIQGNISIMVGNQMPSPSAKVKPFINLKTRIYAYELTRRDQADENGVYYSNLKTRLVATALSDSHGHYIIHLPVGKYSILAEHGGHLFANLFDGEGNINPVKVAKDSLTTLNITITAGAVF